MKQENQGQRTGCGGWQGRNQGQRKREEEDERQGRGHGERERETRERDGAGGLQQQLALREHPLWAGHRARHPTCVLPKLSLLTDYHAHFTNEVTVLLRQKSLSLTESGTDRRLS